jgi:transcriptional regulator with AAA-type ATPase domain
VNSESSGVPSRAFYDHGRRRAARRARGLALPPAPDEVITPTEYQEHGLVGLSGSMAKVVSTIHRIAPTNALVFITDRRGRVKSWSLVKCTV